MLKSNFSSFYIVHLDSIKQYAVTVQLFIAFCSSVSWLIPIASDKET